MQGIDREVLAMSVPLIRWVKTPTCKECQYHNWFGCRLKECAYAQKRSDERLRQSK